jgi:hypothetical protein
MKKEEKKRKEEGRKEGRKEEREKTFTEIRYSFSYSAV